LVAFNIPAQKIHFPVYYRLGKWIRSGRLAILKLYTEKDYAVLLE